MHPDFYTLEIEQATGPGSAGVVFLPRLGLIYIALPNASGTVNVRPECQLRTYLTI